MKVKTHIKAGKLAANHNQTLVRAKPQPHGLKVKTNIKAGVKMNGTFISNDSICHGHA